MPEMSRRDRREPTVEHATSFKLAFRLSVAGRRLAAVGERLSHIRAPRFGAIAALLLSSTALYGMSVGGHTTAVIDALAQPMGFAIDRIDVSGNGETSEIDVLQALWGTGAQSLPSLDPEAARTALEAMPWIEQASVSKTYPDRVEIKLVERAPFAVWQKGRELFIIDKDGGEIMPYGAARFANLPFFVGAGAGKNAAALLSELDVLPELRARVKAYIRVGERRWDLRLENGVTIRLPEEGAIEAAAAVSKMDRDVGLLSRDILAVDMRIADRMVVKLTPDALVRRDAALKEREKVIKRSSKEKPV